MTENPFELTDKTAYQSWRKRKLSSAPGRVENLTVTIADLAAPTAAEIQAVTDACRRSNMAVYDCPTTPRGAVLEDALGKFATAFGLRSPNPHLCGPEDGLTALARDEDDGRRGGYIPYSDRLLNWHADGYYNPPDGQIRALLLHCAADAAKGGENALLDTEIAYIRLRNADPAFIAALMRSDAMTNPANWEGSVEIRPSRSGPVFSTDPLSGTLHMRYTSRKRYIVWKDDSQTSAAVTFLTEMLSGGEKLILCNRLALVQGILANNVLHNRTAFKDDPAGGRKRLIYRACYLNRVADPQPTQPRHVENASA